MLCALIMAGGKGERFWPLSTEDKPKQFLNLLGEKTMIQLTVDRMKKLIPIERIFIITNEKYKELVKENIPDLPDNNIILEPEGRNTAPCIALSAFIIKQYFGDVTLAVLPSDHLVIDEEKFRATINAADEFIDKNEEAIVTIGIRPKRPDTGYGYVKFNEITDKINCYDIRKVENFTEKPSLEKAQTYIKDGRYLWNSGIFVWKLSEICNLTKEFLPKTYDVVKEIAVTYNSEYDEVKEKYKDVDPISVDYGIMEKAKYIYVIPSDFGWDDLGTWASLKRCDNKDENGNFVIGHINTINSKSNIINTKKKTHLVGVNNLIVIETDNEIVIVNKDCEEQIKELRKYEK